MQTCTKCRRNPGLRRAWGCDEPSLGAVEDGVPDDDGLDMEYYSCPMLFIPDAVWEWYELYSYIEKFPHTAPAYHEQSPRYAEFKRYFLSRKGEYEEAMRRGGEVR